jgi:hypothetical protein
MHGQSSLAAALRGSSSKKFIHIVLFLQSSNSIRHQQTADSKSSSELHSSDICFIGEVIIEIVVPGFPSGYCKNSAMSSRIFFSVSLLILGSDASWPQSTLQCHTTATMPDGKLICPEARFVLEKLTVREFSFFMIVPFKCPGLNTVLSKLLI